VVVVAAPGRIKSFHRDLFRWLLLREGRPSDPSQIPSREGPSEDNSSPCGHPRSSPKVHKKGEEPGSVGTFVLK